MRWFAELYFQRLRWSDRPILIGPWRGEVGFEVLYWLPFLKRVVERYRLRPNRLRVLTRGGAAVWYDAIAPEGSQQGIEPHRMQPLPPLPDLFLQTPLERYRIEARADYLHHHQIKQVQVTAYDRELVAGHLAGHWWLHPMWFYALLAPFWEERAPWRLVHDWLPDVRIAPPPLPEGWQLPPEYVAVRFYWRSTFPLRAETVEFAQSFTARLAKKVPIVVLTSGIHADDHADVLVHGDNIWSLPATPAATNLAALSAVLGRATAFVGTYGGLAQLALRMGIPSLSFYAQWSGTAPLHKLLSDYVALRTGIPFYVAPIGHVPYLQGLIG